MKPIKEILVSPGFMREVSILLFGFAAISGLYAVALLAAGGADPEALDLGIGTEGRNDHSFRNNGLP